MIVLANSSDSRKVEGTTLALKKGKYVCVCCVSNSTVLLAL